MRYFLELEYNGSNFHGWQTQPNASSVQATIENGLNTIFKENIALTGAGRTDTGVHARQMFAHFDVANPIYDEKRFLLSLNSLVGKDITIKDIRQVEDKAHARFDAKERTYKYFVSHLKNSFLKDFCWHSPNPLDIDSMNQAAETLLETKDFTSFAKLHSDAKTNICDVIEAKWTPLENDFEAQKFMGNLNGGLVFTITADRFLRNMVRAIVGTLVEVGRHKISKEDFEAIIKEKNRCSAGTSMPAQALFLWRIKYPFL